MAHLSGPDGAFIEFCITQYEFPDMDGQTGDKHDLNWVRVQFRVCDGERQWIRDDPAWQTGDLPALAAWLRQTASGNAPPEPWTALEPLLTLVCECATPTVELTAELRLELRSEDEKTSNLDSEAVRLMPTNDELLQAAEVLDEALQRLPPR